MRLLVIVFCISGFLAKDIARISWEIWFKVNQEQIIAEKCENKAIPMMHCNGKCYLAKQLQKLEEKEQNHNSKTNPFGQPFKADWIVNHEPTHKIEWVTYTETPFFASHPTEKPAGYSAFVFHPPAQ